MPYRNPNLRKTGYYPEIVKQAESINAYKKAMKGIDPRTMNPQMKSLLRRTGFLK